MRIFAVVVLMFIASSAHALSAAEVKKILVEIDNRQTNGGDWKAKVYIETREKNKNDVVYDAVTYRRDEDDKLMILFLRPKAERGKGYLRMDKNLWFYDPRVGKWERRTERERIGGTGSNRNDFDESRLAREYNGKFAGNKKLGKFNTYKLVLTAKKGVDVAYPAMNLWVDAKTTNVLKRQDLAASGRLMRTTYYPKWSKVFSKSKGQEVWFPKQIRIFDEIEKGNKTTVVVKQVDLDPLPANIFTKAWLESKSR